MTFNCLGIIGFGSIASTLMKVLETSLDRPIDCIVCLVRPGSLEKTRRAFAGHAAVAQRLEAVDALDGLIAARPGLVIECAGHEAVQSFAVPLLQHGIETVVTSIGALSDPDLHAELIEAAKAGNTRMVLPAGAVGGIDILSAISRSGIESVTYTSRKPPQAWRGTPAEALLDLGGLAEEAVFYQGTARAAASDYPKNANVAATIALAGAGFENTRVRMVADPAVDCNVHEFDVRSAAAEVSITVRGRPSPQNPKTSLPTVYSLAREVINRLGPVAI